MKYRIKYEMNNDMFIGFLYEDDAIIFVSQPFKTKGEANQAISRIINLHNTKQIASQDIPIETIEETPSKEDVVSYEPIDKPMYYIEKSADGKLFGVVFHRVNIFINGLFQGITEQILYVTKGWDTDEMVKNEIVAATSRMFYQDEQKPINTTYNKNTLH